MNWEKILKDEDIVMDESDESFEREGRLDLERDEQAREYDRLQDPMERMLEAQKLQNNIREWENQIQLVQRGILQKKIKAAQEKIDELQIQGR